MKKLLLTLAVLAFGAEVFAGCGCAARAAAQRANQAGSATAAKVARPAR